MTKILKRVERTLKKRRYTLLIIISFIIAMIFLGGFAYQTYQFLFQPPVVDQEVPSEESTKISELEAKLPSEETPASETETLTSEEIEQARLDEQMSHTQVTNPMDQSRLDESVNPDILGKIIIKDPSNPEADLLNIDYWQGVGYETGDEWLDDPSSDDQRLLKASGVKKGQKLGEGNAVFAAHSFFKAGPNEYFNPLLQLEDGSLIENPEVEQLKLKNGIHIYILQNSDDMYYKYQISEIFTDYDSASGYMKTREAQGDISGRPQATFYVCTDSAGSGRLVIKAEFVSKFEADSEVP